MNIFWTDTTVKACAEHLDDLRARKMLVEHCQMLSTAINYHLPVVSGKYRIYKSCYENHPCTLWVKKSRINFFLLCSYTKELCKRFPNHKTVNVFNEVMRASLSLPNDSLSWPTEPPKCNPYKDVLGLTVQQSYRLTMIDKWNNDKRLPTWTTGVKPSWYLPK